MLEYGTSPGDYTGSIDVGISSATVCDLSLGRYYVAVRARNYLGVLSGYSVERFVDLTATPVFITEFSAEPFDYSVRVRWEIWADEGVAGFDIYRAPADDPENEQLVNRIDMIDAAETEFVDETVASETAYVYRLVAYSDDGDVIVSQPARVTSNAVELMLNQNAPNPFNPSTRIAWVMPEGGRARIRVYDVRGALVATLFDGQSSRGRNEVYWDGRNDAGQRGCNRNLLLST